MIPAYSFPDIYLGVLTIPTYPLFHGLAYVVAAFLVFYEARRRGLDLDAVFKLFLVGFAGAIIGARLGGVVSNWELFSETPSLIFNLGVGGWTEAGGFLLAMPVMLLYIWWGRLPLWTMLDAMAPALAARFAVSRIGCAAVHDHIGTVMSEPWPWGVMYQGDVRHETALYSLVVNALIFLILWLSRKRIQTKGMLFSLYLIMYSAGVFIIRFFRAVDLPFVSDPRFFGLTATQYFAIIVLCVGLGLFIWLNRRKNRSVDA